MKKGIKAVLILVPIAVVLIVAAIWGKKRKEFDREAHLDEEVIWVDDTGITLREFGYYIFQVEAFVQKQALLYDPEDPNRWWNTHFSAQADSQFVCDYAKKVAINMCTADEIYYQEAVSEGTFLSADEGDSAKKDAEVILQNMDAGQRAATGLNETLILTLSKKHALAAKYAEKLITERNLAALSDDPHALVNWDGTYYLEQILPEHTTRTNDSLLDRITFGKITVNME